ncbi:hypothetical protein ONZ45_g13744 [Pleurotus djamor]|nr:hypothetical protein ONZ45_g13744 [Pleurotus djamor]
MLFTTPAIDSLKKKNFKPRAMIRFVAYVMLGMSGVALTMASPVEANIDANMARGGRVSNSGGNVAIGKSNGNGDGHGVGAQAAGRGSIQSGGTLVAALILIADGTEEMEFTITYDTLVRSGITCTSAFVPASAAGSAASPPFAKGSRGINIQPDRYFEKAHCGPEHFDSLVIPGGAVGASTLSKSTDVQELVREYLKQDKVVGMICAGSLAALTSKLPRQRLTSHPSVKADLEKGEYLDIKSSLKCRIDLLPSPSRGPGTAFPFAFTIVELLRGSEARDEVKAPMIFPPGTPY